MRLSLNQAEALQLATFIVENQERIQEGIHLQADDKGLVVEARGEDGRITEAAKLHARGLR